MSKTVEEMAKDNTAILFIGGTQLIIQGYTPSMVVVKLEQSFKAGTMATFPLSKNNVEGVNPSAVMFVARATLVAKKVIDMNNKAGA